MKQKILQKKFLQQKGYLKKNNYSPKKYSYSEDGSSYDFVNMMKNEREEKYNRVKEEIREEREVSKLSKEDVSHSNVIYLNDYRDSTVQVLFLFL